mgnify:CR=1 FL=1|tara:strand:- start:3422 stop:3844 length:423 start_codon:yes stop_codon:yes gene_type:complete
MHKDYFEGILQLRDVSKEVYSFVNDLIEQREGVNIAKIKHLKNGKDLYISSQKYLQIIGKRLVEKFGGEYKVSTKLHTRNRVSSKEVHRVTVLFRQPKFKKGDTITHRGDELLILNLSKKVYCKNLSTGKKVTIRYDKLN